MKLPGKRDRLRPEPDQGPVEPQPAKPAGVSPPQPPAEPAPEAAAPESVEAPAAPAAEPAAAAPAPDPRVPLGWVVGAVAALALGALWWATSGPEARELQASPSPDTPALTPLASLPDPAPVPSSTPDPLEGVLAPSAPLPPPEPRHPGNGFVAYREGLALVPSAPPAHVTRQLQRLARDPEAELDEAAQRYVRACWPALQALERAACSTSFTRDANAPELADLMQPRRLALAALATGRAYARSGDRCAHARWPLVVLRVGRGLAAGGTVFETSYGLGLAQLGQQALEAACADLERWQAPELAWLGERLHALPPAAEGVPRFDGALSAEQQAAGAQQLAATRERAESGLRALRTRIDDALRQRAGGVK